MKLRHKKPCKECPWRKNSPKGWLGGYSPEMYADAVANNEVPACHLRDKGPDDERTSMCAGALSVMCNSANSAWKTKDGDKARALVGKRLDTFSHHAEFYKYHSGKDYVSLWFRRL